MNYDRDMKRYCCKCPCFKIKFIFCEKAKTCSYGFMYGKCCNPKKRDSVTSTSMTLCSFKMSNGLKSKCEYEAPRVMTVDFKREEIPRELLERTEIYTGIRDCILPMSDMDCFFHAERKLEEWNKE